MRKRTGDSLRGEWLKAEEVVFAMGCERFEAIGGEKGREWGDEQWKEREGHIRRMELIRRATAPRRLTEPGSTKVFDIMANALTGNKVQLFPTRQRPKLQALDVAGPGVAEAWFKTSEISIGSGMTHEQQAKAVHRLYTSAKTGSYVLVGPVHPTLGTRRCKLLASGRFIGGQFLLNPLLCVRMLLLSSGASELGGLRLTSRATSGASGALRAYWPVFLALAAKLPDVV